MQCGCLLYISINLKNDYHTIILCNDSIQQAIGVCQLLVRASCWCVPAVGACQLLVRDDLALPNTRQKDTWGGAGIPKKNQRS